jgi:DNA-directed RNA polymerase
MFNEQKMKTKGESMVWDSVFKSNGEGKDIASIQLGQTMLFKEALRILPLFRNWIDGSNKADRLLMREMFKDDDVAVELILKTMFLMCGAYSGALESDLKSKVKNRHRSIKSIHQKIYSNINFQQTWRIVEVIVELSKYFEVHKVSTITKGKLLWSVSYTCNISEDIYTKLSARAVMAFYPMPMTEKPKDWGYDEHGEIVGGYMTKQYDIVRTKVDGEYNKRINNRIFESLNYIQSQCWVINEDVLEFVEQNLQIPLKTDYVSSRFPEKTGCLFGVSMQEIEETFNEESAQKVADNRKTFQDGVELFQSEVRDFESAVGKYRAVKMAIDIANEYKGQDLYFPHSFDSRGRVYPIPVGLNPQGSDAIKAMLTYKEGQVLNQEGAAWAFAYLASLYGDDKLHFEDRVERGMELINADYMDADEPYQFLSHQMEIHKILENPKTIFRGRVHLDACNSGSQFTSALTGDVEGCVATNVIPTIKEGLCDRKDVYLLVSNKSISTIQEILNTQLSKEDRDVYEMLLDLLSENGRKICKRPVMVSNYGGTAGGRADMLYDMFRELKIEKRYITKSNAIKLAKVIGDSITGVLNGGKSFEKYIQTMNGVITKGGSSVTWKTGDGFNVVHKKVKELKPKQVGITLPRSRKRTFIIIKQFSKDVSPAKMRSAISPNYIHSLDAELLRRVALEMKEQGIENSDWIHDSFGCLPNDVNEMLNITKIIFKEMMEDNPLLRLDEELRRQATYNGTTGKQLAKVILPQLGEIDFSSLVDSEWFFS